MSDTNDIAALGFSIDTSELKAGQVVLEQFESTATNTASAADRFQSSIDAMTGASEHNAQAITALAAALEKLRLDQQAQQAKQAADTLQKLEQAWEFVKTAAEAYGVIKVAEFFVEQTRAAIDLATALEKLSLRTGSTIETLSAISDTAVISGTSLDLVGTSMDRLGRAAAESSDKNSAAARAFTALGVSVKDANGNVKDEGTLMLQVAQALGQYANGAEKVNDATILMGRGAANNIPFLRGLAESAGTSSTVSKEAAEASLEFEENLGKLKVQSQGLWVEFANNLLPTLNKYLEFAIKAKSLGGILDFVASGAKPAIFDDTLAKLEAQKQKVAELTAQRDKLIAEGGLLTFFGQLQVTDFGLKVDFAINELNKLQKVVDTFGSGAGSNADAGSDWAHGAVKAPAPHVSTTPPVDTTQNQIQELQKLQDAQLATIKQAESLDKEYNTEALAANKYYHDARMINEQDFLDNKIRLNKQELQNELSAVNAQIAVVQDTYSKQQDIADNAPNEQAQEKANDRLIGQEKELATLRGQAAILTAKISAADVQGGQEKLLALQKEQDAIETLNQSYDTYLRKLGDQRDKDQLNIDIIGKTKEEQASLNAEYSAEIEIRDKLLDLIDKLHKAEKEKDDDMASAVRQQITDVSNGAQAEVQAAGARAASIQTLQQRQKDLEDGWKAVDDLGQQAFEAIFSSGNNAFQQLADSLKKNLIDLLYQMTVKKWIFQIFAEVTGSGSNTGLAQQALGSGSGNPLSNLFGNFGGGGGGFGGLTDSFATSGLGSSLGLSTPALETAAGMSAEVGAGTAAVGAELTEAGASLTGLAAGIGSFIPYIGIAIAAFTLLSGLFKGGGPKSGGFAETSGADVLGNDQRYFTPNDKDSTLQTTVDSLNKSFSDALTLLGGKGTAGFALGFDTDPQGTANSRTSAGATVNGQLVFNQHDVEAGRDDATLQASLAEEAQRALLAALQKSDLPDYIANLLNSVDANTATTDQISKVLASAEALKTAVTEVGSLGDALQNLDPANLSGLIDAFGGIDQFTTAFKFIGDNFTTNAQKFNNAQQQLDDGFAKLNVSVPETHQQFLDLLNSIDTTTDGGKQMYASVAALGPLFVSISGTAEQLAEALRPFPNLAQLSDDALGGLVSAFGGMAQFQNSLSAFGTNFTTTAQRVALAQTQLTNGFAQLNIAIPETHQQFLDLLNGLQPALEAADPTAEQTYAALMALAPAFLEVSGTAQQAADALQQQASTNASYFQSNFFGTTQGQAEHLADLQGQLAAASTRLGVAIPTTIDGFREMIIGMEQAGQKGSDLYNSLLALAPAVHDIATATQEVVNVAVGIGDAIGEGTSAANSYIGAINAVTGSMGSSFDTADKLTKALDLLTGPLATAQYAVDHDPGASSPNNEYTLELRGQLDALKQYQADLTGQLSDFVTWKAQYGEAIADQLLQLRNQYDAEAPKLSDADALKSLQEIYNQNFQAIVAGISNGVDGAIDQLQKLRDGIAQYLQNLATGDLSPLTPMEKLVEAKAQLDAEYDKAKAGDQTALGDITKYLDTFLNLDRDAFKSSTQYLDDYNEYTAKLGFLANTTPQGNPIKGDPVVALAVALPDNGDKLASAKDIQTMTAALIATQESLNAAVSNTNSSNSSDVVASINDLKSTISTALQALR